MKLWNSKIWGQLVVPIDWFNWLFQHIPTVCANWLFQLVVPTGVYTLLSGIPLWCDCVLWLTWERPFLDTCRMDRAVKHLMNHQGFTWWFILISRSEDTTYMRYIWCRCHMMSYGSFWSWPVSDDPSSFVNTSQVQRLKHDPPRLQIVAFEFRLDQLVSRRGRLLWRWCNCEPFGFLVLRRFRGP